MKKITAFVAMALVLAMASYAIDDQGWLQKARQCVADGAMLDSDETEEDGVYCLVLAAIYESETKGVDQRVSEAILEAKRKMTAYVHGEQVSGMRTVESSSKSISVDGEKTSVSASSFRKKITSKVNALMRGAKVVGQITYEEKSYVVYVSTERFADDSTILQAAQAEYGDEGVAKGVGEAATEEMARQRAMRSVIEQVLGTVVVGYDKMSTSSDFQSKMFSGTDGVVEKYRIVSDTEIEGGHRIELVAKVSKVNLLDSYRNYMKFLGDPFFYVASNSPALSSRFTEFFTDMDIRTTERRIEAQYIIDCYGDFRSVTNPLNGRKGIQLSLRFKVRDAKTNEVLIDFRNDPKKSNSFQIGGEDRQKELCAERAFQQMKKPLHAKIQDMVSRLVGRAMDAAAQEE